MFLVPLKESLEFTHIMFLLYLYGFISNYYLQRIFNNADALSR